MRHLIAPLSLSLSFSLALVAAPAFFAATLPAEEKKEEAHAEPKPIGEVSLNGATFTVALESELKAGKEVEVKLMPKGALPKGTVRGWIGLESGKGSAKSKAHDEDGGWCVHVEVPDSIPAEAKIWFEIDVDGTKSKAGVGIPTGK